jgi:hypothetical protein
MVRHKQKERVMFDFLNQYMNGLKQSVGANGIGPAFAAGRRGAYAKCETNEELAAWFSGVAAHIRRDIRGPEA